MTCRYCQKEIPLEDIRFCPYCGKTLVRRSAPKKRGNGTGTVYQLPNGKFIAVVQVGEYVDKAGKLHRKTRSKVFDKKTDAWLALTELKQEQERDPVPATFRELYDKWLPTHRVGKSTLDCYRAAMRYLEPVWYSAMPDITVDDLQECLDDCPKGKRTKENMRAVIGLVYKYGIPRKAVPDNLNLAPFLVVEGESAAHRISFTDEQITAIKKACGSVPHAEDILCMIYTGFRPSEFLALTADSYDKQYKTIKGGSKTAAGMNRIVTVAPAISAIIERRAAAGGYLFADDDGRQWNLKGFSEKAFYPALEQIGIDNPIVGEGGAKRHMYTPHSCRHTFATLLKRVQGAEKDKLELMGHASGEMLRYYQDTAIEDLRKITDKI